MDDHRDQVEDLDTEMARLHGEDIPTDLVITIGIVGAVLLLVIVVGTQAWYYSALEAVRQEQVVNAPNTWLMTVQNEQLELLNSYGQTNAEAGQARVPIDRGIELWVAKQENAPLTETGAP